MIKGEKSASAIARKQAMRMQARTARRNCVAREARGASKPKNTHREAQVNQGTRAFLAHEMQPRTEMESRAHREAQANLGTRAFLAHEMQPRTEMEEEYERSEKPHDK